MIAPSDRFSDLITFVNEYRRRRAEGLIIMPFFNAYDCLFEHLKLLQKQTFQDFDLIIILSSTSDENKVAEFIKKKEFDYGIILAKRKEDTGSAGGFFTGEKFALENGYGYIIIADDDCFPANQRHIETLVEEYRKGNPLVYAKAAFLLNGEEAYHLRRLPYYSLISIELVKKAGLHFAPMYIGAEDLEYEDRLFLFAKPTLTKSRVTHPGWHSIFNDFERSVRYRINEMLLGLPAHSVAYLYGFAVMTPCYIIFGTSRVRRGGFHMAYCMTTHRFGQEAAKGLAGAPAAKVSEPDFDITISTLQSQNGPSYFLYRYDIVPKLGNLSMLAFATMRKNTLLMPVNTFGALVPVIVAKETWVSSKSGKYPLAENRNVLVHLFKLILFGLLFPGFFAFGVLTLFLNWIRKPKTRGYGL